jgi:hypothetical protein
MREGAFLGGSAMSSSKEMMDTTSPKYRLRQPFGEAASLGEYRPRGSVTHWPCVLGIILQQTMYSQTRKVYPVEKVGILLDVME